MLIVACVCLVDVFSDATGPVRELRKLKGGDPTKRIALKVRVGKPTEKVTVESYETVKATIRRDALLRVGA